MFFHELIHSFIYTHTHTHTHSLSLAFTPNSHIFMFFLLFSFFFFVFHLEHHLSTKLVIYSLFLIYLFASSDFSSFELDQVLWDSFFLFLCFNLIILETVIYYFFLKWVYVELNLIDMRWSLCLNWDIVTFYFTDKQYKMMKKPCSLRGCSWWHDVSWCKWFNCWVSRRIK